MHENSDFTDRLWTFIQGNPDSEMEAHLQSCHECHEEQVALSGLLALRGIQDVPLIPGALSSTLNGLLTKVRPDLVTRAQQTSTIKQRVRKVLADLIQDTSRQPQIVGLRGETRTRQIAFTSHVADLDLEVSPTENQFLVVGQLGMDEVPHDLTIRFVPADQDPLAGTTDSSNVTRLSEQGHFRMTMSPGNWVIAVVIEDAVVVFPGIEL